MVAARGARAKELTATCAKLNENEPFFTPLSSLLIMGPTAYRYPPRRKDVHPPRQKKRKKNTATYVGPRLEEGPVMATANVVWYDDPGAGKISDRLPPFMTRFLLFESWTRTLVMQLCRLSRV